MRPSLVRVAELMGAAVEVDEEACWTLAGGFPPAITPTALAALVVVVAPTRPSFVRVLELMDAAAAEGAAPDGAPPAMTPTVLPALVVVVAPTSPSFVKEPLDAAAAAGALLDAAPPAITPTALAALVVVVAPTSPSLVKEAELTVLLEAAAAWAFPPPAITPTVLATFVVVVAPTKPSLVNVAELMDGGATELDSAAAWPTAGEPPATTVTAPAIVAFLEAAAEGGIFSSAFVVAFASIGGALFCASEAVVEVLDPRAAWTMVSFWPLAC